jgi:hypothetical protein
MLMAAPVAQQQQQQESLLSGPVLHTGFFEALLQQELQAGGCSSSVRGCQDDSAVLEMDMAALDEQIRLVEQELLLSAAADRHGGCGATHQPARYAAAAAAGVQDAAAAAQDAMCWQPSWQQQQQQQLALRKQQWAEEYKQNRRAKQQLEQQLRLVQQQQQPAASCSTSAPAATAAAGVPQAAESAPACCTPVPPASNKPVTDSAMKFIKQGQSAEQLSKMMGRLSALTAEYQQLESSLMQLQVMLNDNLAAPAAVGGVSCSAADAVTCFGGAAGEGLWECQQQQQQQQQLEAEEPEVWQQQEPAAHGWQQLQQPLPLASCGVFSHGVCFFV